MLVSDAFHFSGYKPLIQSISIGCKQIGDIQNFAIFDFSLKNFFASVQHNIHRIHSRIGCLEWRWCTSILPAIGGTRHFRLQHKTIGIAKGKLLRPGNLRKIAFFDNHRIGCRFFPAIVECPRPVFTRLWNRKCRFIRTIRPKDGIEIGSRFQWKCHWLCLTANHRIALNLNGKRCRCGSAKLECFVGQIFGQYRLGDDLHLV